MLHFTAGLVDFLMSLMVAGAWALAWAFGGIALCAAMVSGAVALWRRGH